MKFKKIVILLLTIILGVSFSVPAYADTVKNLTHTSGLEFVVLVDESSYVRFYPGVTQSVNVSLYSYPTYKKVTKINSLSYTNFFVADPTITGEIEVHNDQILMSDINETPLIYDGNVLVSTSWIWDNDYVIPGTGSTYGFSNPVKIEATGFLWVPEATYPFINFGFTGNVT